jgi:uncharacterized protein (DUF362 family)
MAVSTPDAEVGFARNLTLTFMLFATLAVAASAEGYASRLSLLFVGLLAVGLGLFLWLGTRTTTARLLALLTLVFFMEYTNQTIGIASGLWQYHGVGGQYVFGVMAWLVAACSAQALSTGVTIPLVRRLHLRTPRWLTSVLVLALLALIPLTAGRYGSSMGVSFWCFFGLVGVIAMLAAQQMPIHVFVGVVLSAWFVGGLSEYVGSASSGCWTFPYNPHYPPFYLVVGCWPLEILVQFSVSAFLAGEPVVAPAWLQATTAQPPSVVPTTAAAQSNDCTDDDTAKRNRQLCLFLIVSSLMYLVAGSTFAVAPNWVLGEINKLSAWLTPSLPLAPLPGERFWVSLSFSMMMTITALCVVGAATVRRNKIYVFAVMIAKLASTVSALAYFLFFRHHLASLVIVIVDGSLFCLTGFFVFRALKSFFRKQTGFCYSRFPQPRSSGPATVAVSQGKDDKERFESLKEVLLKTDFFGLLDRRFAETHKTRKEFRIVIKPNFMFTHSQSDPSTYTDPTLVEWLVDRIAERGFTNITLVEAQSTYGNYYANREVLKVAEHVGYHLDKNYKIVDLTQEREPFDYGGRLGKHFVGPTWRDADFRISFAKNKTHIFCNYTLTLKNIYGTLPMQDKLCEYHTKREYDWPTIETLKHFPVHFGLVDAYKSADGQFGVIADPHPKDTNTIIGGENLIAVDWVGAKKMGLNPDDPLIGRFLPLAMQAFGKPEVHCLGDLSPYPHWKNVSRFFIYSLDLFEEAYDFSNWWFSVLTAQDKYFTFMKKDWPTRLMRKLLAPIKRLLYPHDAL